ncbi:uroporphyrinogen-III synthase [Catenulispora yoronensis]|uniref:Uroporphyrinogen-III synthase n=1 Tax=Catenulispora yoronensis TaxID=450799 RepID=A0ABN2TUP5_9ACTN
MDTTTTEPDTPGSPASPTPGTTGSDPLIGCVVAITSDRRREELGAMLRRRGAEVMMAPTMRIIPLHDDRVLRAATEECLRGPLDYAVATTGIGWRAWISTAEGWGLGEPLTAALAEATLTARGPKATGAIRQCGMRETYSPPSESSTELLDWLLARDLAGTRIAVQLHGSADTVFLDALRGAGAEVVPVPVYQWGPPQDTGAVNRLIEAVVRRQVHAVAFTSAPGAAAFLAAAENSGNLGRVVEAMQADVMAACIGTVCAAPLEPHGITTVSPDRGRLGSLARVITQELPPRVRRRLNTPGRDIVVQGNAVLIDGRPVPLPPLPAGVLRELARQPGRVLSRAELLRRVWTGMRRDEHAVEATVARLRSSLGEHADVIATVTKRGYRLAVEPG